MNNGLFSPSAPRLIRPGCRFALGPLLLTLALASADYIPLPFEVACEATDASVDHYCRIRRDICAEWDLLLTDSGTLPDSPPAVRPALGLAGKKPPSARRIEHYQSLRRRVRAPGAGTLFVV